MWIAKAVPSCNLSFTWKIACKYCGKILSSKGVGAFRVSVLELLIKTGLWT